MQINLPDSQVLTFLSFCKARVEDLNSEIQERIAEIQELGEMVDLIEGNINYELGLSMNKTGDYQAEKKNDSPDKDLHEFASAVSMQSASEVLKREEPDGSVTIEGRPIAHDFRTVEPKLKKYSNESIEKRIARQPKNKITKNIKEAKRHYNKPNRIQSVEEPPDEVKKIERIKGEYSNRKSLYPELQNESIF